jgi:hypothetical protein
VPKARDGKELGEALDKRDHDCLKVREHDQGR